MGQNSTRLHCEKIGEVGEETSSKSKHTKNKQYESSSLRDYRDSCIWKFASLLGTCAVIYQGRRNGFQSGGAMKH